ncbi:hypothetical protein [Marinifilum sp. D737]|uniref:hypothetical protein n=1 Tax=Marinifilum sp. D737 TaxID=2969628 RepID=UPI0022730096|nr:hypothetical protein [Marinifilum sp. D737]MCY1636559.1 hypothetical protein [Marinifilum sp. D737]
MKRNYFYLIAVAAATMFTACDDSNNVESVKNENHLNKINASAFITFANNTDVMTASGKTKANANVETMWDAYQEIIEYSVDPEKEAEYKQAVEIHADILRPIGNDEYELIISDPVVAQKFNSNGVLAVGNNVYLAETDRITKYEREGEDYRMIDEYDRPYEIGEVDGGGGYTGPSNNDLVITKSGEWLSNPQAINV